MRCSACFTMIIFRVSGIPVAPGALHSYAEVMSGYIVCYASNTVPRPPMSRGEAHDLAMRLSEENAARYFFYNVRYSGGPHDGRIESVWIRGTRCDENVLPRVEVRQNDNTFWRIPVVDKDEDWSLSAAGVAAHRMLPRYDIVLLDPNGSRFTCQLLPEASWGRSGASRMPGIRAWSLPGSSGRPCRAPRTRRSGQKQARLSAGGSAKA